MGITALRFYLPKVRQVPRLVAGCGGWHILGPDGESCGKVTKEKGRDYYIVVLKGTAAEVKQIIDSRILSSLDKH